MSEERPSALRPIAAAIGAIALVGGVALSLAHCTRSRPVDGREGDLVAGAQHYRTYCGLCHGDEGEGYAADNANALANQDFLVSVTDEFLTVNIAEGHPGTPMAPYAQRRGGPLTDEQVAQLVAFIRSWQEEPDAELRPVSEDASADEGREVYAQRCAECHGDAGEGVNAVSLNNPQFLASASDAQIRYAIAHGRRGTPMPAFEGDLADETIDNLTALIRSWQREVAPRETEAPTVGEEMPIVVNPDGEPPQFSELREGRYVPSAEVEQALREGRRMVLLDARAASDYVRYHIPGAIPSPYYGIESVVPRLPRDGTWILAYCACPHAASGRVMDHLRENGFEHTAVIDEGVRHWHDEGYPVVEGPNPGTLADAE